MSEKDDESNEHPFKEAVKHHAGYEPKELLKAPVKPPEPAKTPGPTRVQQAIIGFGMVVAVLGLLLWLVHRIYPMGLITVVVGVALLLWGVLVRQ